VVFPVDLVVVIRGHHPSLFEKIVLNDISVCCFGFKVTWTGEQILRCLRVAVCQNLEAFSHIGGIHQGLTETCTACFPLKSNY